MSSNPALTCPTFSMSSPDDSIRIVSVSPSSARDSNCFSLSGGRVRSWAQASFIGCSAELVGKTHQLPAAAFHLVTQRPHEWGSVSTSQSSNVSSFSWLPHSVSPLPVHPQFLWALWALLASLSFSIVGALLKPPGCPENRNEVAKVSQYEVSWWMAMNMER